MDQRGAAPALGERGREATARPTILFVAGFGDNASMFAAMHETALADTHRLRAIDLPGFGAPAQPEETTLSSLAAFVAEDARRSGAKVIVAHSVASIIASLAAKEADCPLEIILSLEGNLTAEDAYFSGTAADYDDPDSFRTAFLARLDEMAETALVIGRYREKVAKADPLALWQLGGDARRFSDARVPGDLLASAGRATYLYNPANCPASTLEWLERSTMDRIVLPDASHWASVDQPDLLAEKILEALG